MKKTLVAALLATPLLIATSFNALAATTDAVSVTGVSAGSAGDVFVRTSGAFSSEGCTNSTRYLLPRTHGARKELLAILLTAQASDGEVVLGVNGCGTIGAQTYTSIFNVELR